jgi:hypothetical protein
VRDSGDTVLIRSTIGAAFRIASQESRHEYCVPGTPHGARGASAGGGWSTAADLHRFFLALRDNRIIAAGTRETLWTPKPLTPKYGYGFQIGDCFAGSGWIGHDGGFPGVEAFVSYHPSTGHTLVVLSNYYDSALPLMTAFPKEFATRYSRDTSVSA